jgi:hypothetical protein
VTGFRGFLKFQDDREPHAKSSECKWRCAADIMSK